MAEKLPELQANNPVPGNPPEAVGTLTAELSSGGASLTLSQKLPVPLRSSGQTRLLINNELMLVEGTSSTTITIITRGIEETAAVAHANGEKVYHVPTAEGTRKAGWPQILSALPGSPYDGQEIFFQNATMEGEGALWHLRYRAGSASTHKWEFVGGAPMTVKVDTSQTFSAAAGYHDPATKGPEIKVPLAGDYTYIGTANMFVEGQTGQGQVSWGLNLGGVSPAAPDLVQGYANAGQTQTVTKNGGLSGLTASEAVLMQYNISPVGTEGACRWRCLQILPIRLG